MLRQKSLLFKGVNEIQAHENKKGNPNIFAKK